MISWRGLRAAVGAGAQPSPALGLNVTRSSSCWGETSPSQHLLFIPQSHTISDKQSKRCWDTLDLKLTACYNLSLF